MVREQPGRIRDHERPRLKRNAPARAFWWALLLAAAPGLPVAAAASVGGDPEDPEREVREAHLAAKAGRLAEARRRYLEAAPGLPAVEDWLLLRAALVTPDSAGRDAIYQRITLAVARARLLETEALARERQGDRAGAAIRYDSLGRFVDATRLRLSAATRPEERRQLRRTLVEFIERQGGTSQAAPAVALLLSSRLDIPAGDALVVARACARTPGLAPQAVVLYPQALGSTQAGAADRLAYGVALIEARRYREAASALSRIPASAPEWPRGRYQRAVAVSRLGLRDSALALLRPLTAATDAPDDAVNGQALFLSADLRLQAGDSQAARQQWLDLTRRYPKHDRAGRAGFLAALVAWQHGDTRAAAAEWERVHRESGAPDGVAAGYWAARAYLQLDDSATARRLWQAVARRDSLSWYGMASARRLGMQPWSPSPAPDQFLTFADLDSAGERMAELARLDMEEERGWERAWILSSRAGSPERLLAAADLMRREGEPSGAIALGRRALAAGAAPDARTYRLIYPLLHADELRERAEASGLDPLVVAALIRQESVWDAKAKSRAGAMGLMQVMPATGRQIARTLGVGAWTPDLLYDPITNLRFGIHYFAMVFRRFEGALPMALAAYNAGPTRVPVWASGAAATDPDLFVERIPLAETRDYVKVVQRNLVIYSALYGS